MNTMLANGPYRLVVFDWDGTLIDSTYAITLAIERTCQLLGYPPPPAAQARSVIGLSLEMALRQAVPSVQASQVAQFAQVYQREYFSLDPDLRLFEGVSDLLQGLQQRQVEMAIATGKSRRGLDAGLQRHHLGHYFTHTRTAEETYSKPHPQMLEELIDAYGVSPAHVVMVGDTTFDIELAHNAGVDSVAVSYGAHGVSTLQSAKPTVLLDSVAQLQDWLLAHTE